MEGFGADLFPSCSWKLLKGDIMFKTTKAQVETIEIIKNAMEKFYNEPCIAADFAKTDQGVYDLMEMWYLEGDLIEREKTKEVLDKTVNDIMTATDKRTIFSQVIKLLRGLSTNELRELFVKSEVVSLLKGIVKPAAFELEEEEISIIAIYAAVIPKDVATNTDPITSSAFRLVAKSFDNELTVASSIISFYIKNNFPIYQNKSPKELLDLVKGLFDDKPFVLIDASPYLFDDWNRYIDELAKIGVIAVVEQYMEEYDK